MPAEASKVLVRNKESKMSEKAMKYYRKRVGKLLHMVHFSRLEIVNVTRELSKFMTKETSSAHLQAILEEMNYIVNRLERGWYMKPNVFWDGNPDFEFTIEEYADCGYAIDLDSRKSVSGYGVFLHRLPV